MRKLFLLLLILPLFSCRVLNPSVMFKTEKDYPYAADSVVNKSTEFLITEADYLLMRIFTNEGFRLVDVTSGGGVSSNDVMQYLVEPDGTVKLPLIGRVYLKDKTVQQAEKLLEEKYSLYYNSPFVTLRVTNRHVLVFSGQGGKGTVVNLANENTSILEALTLAGGIDGNGKAYRVKIIRGNLKNPEIFLVDLSTVEGMKNSNLTIQSKDIIYVEPAPDYAVKLLAQLAPFIGILTSVLLVIDIFKR